jgi:mRNA interferase RelE/StbE
MSLEVKSKEEINGLKKIQGYETYYRIRLGDYRLGIEIIEEGAKEDGVYFIRFLHRKDIYKYFP